MPVEVQFFSHSLVGPLTILHPKMELLLHREPRELEILFFPILPGSMTTKIECNPALMVPLNYEKKFNLNGHPKGVE